MSVIITKVFTLTTIPIKKKTSSTIFFLVLLLVSRLDAVAVDTNDPTGLLDHCPRIYVKIKM